MENRIKEQQLELFAERTSTQTMRANQLRLTLSTVANTLLVALRRLGLQNTELDRATPGTIRTRLLKVGAQVRVSEHQVLVTPSEAFPAKDNLVQAMRNLAALRAPAPAEHLPMLAHRRSVAHPLNIECRNQVPADGFGLALTIARLNGKNAPPSAAALTVW